MSATASPGGATGNSRAASFVPPGTTDAQAARIQSSPAFQDLQRKRSSFGWTLTIVMLVIYYGFVALVAFAPSVIGVPLLGSVTTGLALGIGVILSAIVLTGIYVARANGEFDRMQAEVVRDAGRAA